MACLAAWAFLKLGSRGQHFWWVAKGGPHEVLLAKDLDSQGLFRRLPQVSSLAYHGFWRFHGGKTVDPQAVVVKQAWVAELLCFFALQISAGSL